MSKSRVILTALVLLIFGVSVGIVAAGLINPAGAQDELEGRRALLQKEETGADGVSRAVGPGGGVSGVAANESYLYVVQGGAIHQFDAQTLALVGRARIGAGGTGGPQPVTLTPSTKIRLESPNKPVSGKMDRLDKDDTDSGGDAGEGDEE